MTPPALEHAGQQQVRELHGCEDVEPEDVLVLGPRHLVELALRITARVVDEVVDPAELAVARRNELLDAVPFGQVGWCAYRRGSARPQLLSDGFCRSH